MTLNTDDKETALLRQMASKAGLPQLKDIQPIAGAGSNRRYYRLIPESGPSVIGTVGDDIRENRAFIALTRHFSALNLPVPQLLAVADDSRCYLQSDAGSASVFDLLAGARAAGKYTAGDEELLGRAMRLLASMQIVGARGLDFNICYPAPAMDRRMIDWDLNYFKYCFLKPSGIEFDEAALQDEFDLLAQTVMQTADESRTFMLRDFQSRNVMVGSGGELTAIDYQGGRRGPAQYDVASFLWQAAARYPNALRQRLIGCYLDARRELDSAFDGEAFMQSLPVFVLFRVLQTLGAYGFRGWIERKDHFLNSIAMGVDNLSAHLQSSGLSTRFPLLTSLAASLSAKFGSEQTARFTHTIPAADNPLTVTVKSFSYKKGIPADTSGNGGGFVFDCRAPHNPGRYEPYKHLTGLDAPVREFLEADGEIRPFIEECQHIVDASVERYLQRGFTSLAVNFGCTGGQHRSVYCADAMARHLNHKYGVRVDWEHREQGLSGTLPARDTTVRFDSYLKYPQKTYTQAGGGTSL